jgi:hypothetical protein
MAVHHSYGKTVTSGLVLYLNAADRNSYTSGSATWQDLSENGNNGTLTNGPTYNSSNGGSIVFDGSNDYVLVLNSSTLSTAVCTVSMWIKFGASLSNDKVLFGKGVATLNRWLFYENGGVQFIYGSVVGQQIPSATLINKWCNIVGVLSSTLLSIYLNGSLYGAVSCVGSTTNTDNIGINSYSTGGYPASAKNISNVQIYNRALSATEVLQNYNASKSRFGLT